MMNIVRVALKGQFLDSALRIAGPLCFLGMQCSSINTAQDIWSSRSTKKLSPLPFLSLLVNCVVWSLYGFLRADSTVLIPNAVGVFVGTGCSVVYHKFCTSPPLVLYGVTAFIIISALALSLINKYKQIGLIGCALAVILMGSPLATLRTVIAEKSTASLPFWTSLTTWLNALSWLSYGLIIAKDPMIYGPNGVGFLLASLQLSLFVIFGTPSQSKLF